MRMIKVEIPDLLIPSGPFEISAAHLMRRALREMGMGKYIIEFQERCYNPRTGEVFALEII